MSGHTKGPWVGGSRNGVDAVQGGCGEWVAILPHGRREGHGVVCDDEHQANARLIAAAPDLLEALTNTAMWMRTLEGLHGELKGGAAQALVDAEAAIRRATSNERDS